MNEKTIIFGWCIFTLGYDELLKVYWPDETGKERLVRPCFSLRRNTFSITVVKKEMVETFDLYLVYLGDKRLAELKQT